MLMIVPRPIWYLSSANTATRITRFTSSWNVPKSMPTRALNPRFMAVNGSTPTFPTRHTVVPSAMHTTPRHENSSLPFRL